MDAVKALKKIKQSFKVQNFGKFKEKFGKIRRIFAAKAFDIIK